MQNKTLWGILVMPGWNAAKALSFCQPYLRVLLVAVFPYLEMHYIACGGGSIRSSDDLMSADVLSFFYSRLGKVGIHRAIPIVMIYDDDRSEGGKPIHQRNLSISDGEHVGVLRRFDIYAEVFRDRAKRRVHAVAEVFRNAMACAWPAKRAAKHAEPGLVGRGFFGGGLPRDILEVAVAAGMRRKGRSAVGVRSFLPLDFPRDKIIDERFDLARGFLRPYQRFFQRGFIGADLIDKL